jgi:flagellar protein FlaG
MAIERVSSSSMFKVPSEKVVSEGSMQLERLFEAKQSKPVYKEEQEASKEQLNNAVKSLNEFLKPPHTSLKFEIHDKLNEYYVTIVDDVTKEVVREIPSKKLLDMHAAMKEFIGLLFDKKI